MDKGGSTAAAKAILASVVISILLYVGVVFSLMLLVPASSFTISADSFSGALRSAGASSLLLLIIEIGALVATASAALAGILRSSRTLYQISKNNLLPEFFRKYNTKKEVATNGILVTMIISIAALFVGNIYVIVAVADFGLIFAYLAVSFALIHFKRLKKDGTFKAPLYPYISVITIIILLAFMYGLPKISLLIGIVLILSSMAIYYSLRELEEKKVIKIKLFK